MNVRLRMFRYSKLGAIYAKVVCCSKAINSTVNDYQPVFRALIDLFTNAVAILNSIVSNSYYGTVRWVN